MKYKILIIKQATAFFLAVFLAFNPLVGGLVLAEEISALTIESATPTPTQTQTETSSTSELTPTPTVEVVVTSEVTPTPTTTVESTITTGDADSQATSQTEVNTNENTLDGSISTPDCTLAGETDCPDDIGIGTSNSAQVSIEATSSAATGENLSVGGDQSTTTGESIAVGLVDNQINTNTVNLEPSSNTSSGPASSSDNISSGEQKTLTVDNVNEVVAQNVVDVQAASGGNVSVTDLGEAKIITGDSLAIANLINLLNTNVVGSNFQILILDVLANENGDIDLNAVWEEILAGNYSGLRLYDGSDLANLQFLISNNNTATLENNVSVYASTGSNEIENSSQADINTGDAVAVANVNNIVNTNIVGSNFFFGIINIIGDYTGNLILPRQELFSSNTQEGSSLTVNNQNSAAVDNNVVSASNTGQNLTTQSGQSTIISGDATAIANSTTVANLNLWFNNWFWFNINNLGGWSGFTYGWTDPEAQEEVEVGVNTFQVEGGAGTTGTALSGSEDSQAVSAISNINNAEIINNIQVTADTGNNQVNSIGGAAINTGSAWSYANLFNLINTNIVGSNWFMGMVNVLGSWTGSVIFAYPDVAVSLNKNFDQAIPGDIVTYTITYQNQGYEEAQDVEIKLNLPQGVSFESDNSGFVFDGSVWKVGVVRPSESKSFNLTAKINPDFSFDQQISFWSKIIPQARAVENQKAKEIVVTADVYTIDPESNKNNNSSSVAAVIYETEDNSGGVTQDQPKLEITARNNVNDFVYPGDTVTFEITVKNIGLATATNIHLTQLLFNGLPEAFGTFEFDLGSLSAGEQGTLSFGLFLPDNGVIPEDDFRTVAYAVAQAPNGNQVRSNDSLTYFNVKYKSVYIPEVEAADKTGEVLGEESACLTEQCAGQDKDILPYVLLFILSTSWFIHRARTRYLIDKKI